MNTIANRQVICDTLIQAAQSDNDIVVLQDLVGIAAGLASCGKKPFAASPASFLSTRSYEQIKIDVAYSSTNVKLIGISGGISYGALGMSHHSLQDIAALSAIPHMRVYLPSDRFQTAKLMKALLQDDKGAYIRVGRNPVTDVYEENNIPFEMDRATKIGAGEDVLIVACGEMVRPAVDAAALLQSKGIACTVLDMYCLKPLDKQSIIENARETRLVVTVEEHAPTGGLGSMVSQVLSAHYPKKVVNLSLPDEPVIAGTSKDVFAYYGLHAEGIAASVEQNL